jgi:hypothetical protein
MEKQIELFNAFPQDVQLYILKENPTFRLISKYHATEGKQLFEDTYCNNPISKHEFLTYIDSNLKPSYTMYAINDNKCKIIQFQNIRGKYICYIVVIKLNGELFTQSYVNYGIYNLKDIDKLYKKYKYIHYDINTVNNIIKKRNCNIHKHNINYSIKYLDNMVSYKKNDVTLENFYNMTILNIYFGKKDIIRNTPGYLNLIDFNDSVVNDKLYIDTVKMYNDNINAGYERMVQQLQQLQ